MTERRDLGAEVARALAVDADAAPASPPPTERPRPILVAWSGGLDSSVLLDLLARDARVGAAVGGARPVAAHLDHAMRADSAADSEALARFAADLAVEFRTHRLPRAPESEGEARTLRYRWLEEVAEETGASAIWTAHHADDQVETVLFRILRGTGVHGLAGIPPRRGRIVRPFLLTEVPVWRSDLLEHARARGLPLRPDPTNEEPVATRNRLRNEALPLLGDVVPGAADALLRLAHNAARTAAELDALTGHVLDAHAHREGSRGMPVDVWARADAPLRRALLRGAARSLGVALSEAATRAALSLPPDTQSGRGVDLPGGLRFERELDRWTLTRGSGADPTGDPQDPSRAHIVIAGPDAGSNSVPPGSAALPLGGRVLGVAWWSGSSAPDDPSALDDPSPGDGDASGHLAVAVPDAAFPLTIRGWRPGDRISRSFGSTPIAKAWAEARVPRRKRAGRWVLVDREGTVLAAEGLGTSHPRDTLGDGAEPVTYLHLRLDADA